jgi:exodeoxyribonuclease VII large subunit
LYQEFLRLKARLEAEGLFDEQRKRAIPPAPRCIGIVTSATGAALQDMLNTLQGRYPLVRAILAPAAVQGDEAPPQLVAALHALNALDEVEVILIARGGGSMEDLWCFNDERVVRAVAQSRVPVISGVGHETDFTLTDFAADLRAPTPTAAAMLATPDIGVVRQALMDLTGQLALSVQQNLSSRRVELDDHANRIRRASPLWRIQNNRQRLDQAAEGLQRAFEHTLALKRANLGGLEAHLRSLDPRAVLQRGYALLSAEDGRLVTSTGQVSAGQPLRADLADGSLKVEVQAIIKKQEQAR